MSRGRKWTKAEEEWLRESWGSVSIGAIARKLNRSVSAVKVRAQRLGLGPWLMGGDYVSLNQLAKAMGMHKVNSYMDQSWIRNRKLPVHFKVIHKCRFRVVYLDEFWKWAEKNRAFIDFSKMEPLSLGAEPDWVKVQRRKDSMAFAIQRKDRWTQEDDQYLEALCGMQRYTYLEVSRMLRRGSGAITRRCVFLGIKARPLRDDAHSVWTEADIAALEDGIRNGDSYGLISMKVAKSEKAVRTYVFRFYGTEKADAVRAMMGKGHFGAGAPERKDA